jgi:hypothetical protein
MAGVVQELLDGTLLEEGKRLFVTWPDYIIESLVVKLEEEDKETGYRRACVGVNWHGLYILVPLAKLVKEKGVRISWSGWR